MAHPQQQAFVQRVKDRFPAFFKETTVVEFGSLNLNGTVRTFFEDCNYTGVDICEGKDVDVVSHCDNYHPEEVPDVVISCEMLEHDEFWSDSVRHMAEILKPGGLLILTCATTGRKEHGTENFSPADSPATNGYYLNLDMADLSSALYGTFIGNGFDRCYMEVNRESQDLYVWAIKRNA